jgi:pyruvate dehydrogenase E1 component alpha subunit
MIVEPAPVAPVAASAAGVLEPARARQWLAQMLLIRRFEEKAAELYGQGKIRGFLHLCIGEEAVSVGALAALTPDDNLVSTYREHGHAIARGVALGPIMAELFGKANGVSRGRGGSMHLFDVSRRFYGGNAIVGGGLPLAVGLALADQLQHRRAVTACLFGDGAVAEGEFHEALNLAALWHLPVLFLCENNFYAMGTALERHQAQTDISRKGASYGIPGEAVDGMDLVQVAEATGQAAQAVRAGGGPRLLEYRTYRFRAHSMYDAELYRSRDEVERWKQRDPIALFQGYLLERHLVTPQDIAALAAQAAAETDRAVEFAEAGDWEPATDLLRDVETMGAR